MENKPIMNRTTPDWVMKNPAFLERYNKEMDYQKKKQEAQSISEINQDKPDNKTNDK